MSASTMLEIFTGQYCYIPWTEKAVQIELIQKKLTGHFDKISVAVILYIYIFLQLEEKHCISFNMI